VALRGKSPLPILHLAAEIGPYVEPVVVFGLIEVVQPVGKTSQGVLIHAHLLAGLKDAEQDVLRVDTSYSLVRCRRRTTEKDRPGKPPTCLQATKSRVLRLDFNRLGPLAIDVAFDDGV